MRTPGPPSPMRVCGPHVIRQLHAAQICRNDGGIISVLLSRYIQCKHFHACVLLLQSIVGGVPAPLPHASLTLQRGIGWSRCSRGIGHVS